MNSTSPVRQAARLRSSAGFTLLEVMCAFAILVLVTGTITVACHQAMEDGGKAVDLRELREAADTVFRRVLYEDGTATWKDRQTGTLDYYYGDFAQLRGQERDRWQSYGMEYRRVAKVAAGSLPNGQAEPLFGGNRSTSRSGSSNTGRTGTGTTGTGTTGTGTTGTGTGTTTTPESETSTGETLWQITLRFYRVDEPGVDLLTLQTFLPPQADANADGSSTGTTSR